MNGGDLLQLLAAVELWVLLHNMFIKCIFVTFLWDSQGLDLMRATGQFIPLLLLNEMSLSSFNRDWRYHKEERVWITRAPGMEPTLKTNTYERGTYYFFDCLNWRKVAKVRFSLSVRKGLLTEFSCAWHVKPSQLTILCKPMGTQMALSWFITVASRFCSLSSLSTKCLSPV